MALALLYSLLRRRATPTSFSPPRRVQWWGSLVEQSLPASSLTRNSRNSCVVPPLVSTWLPALSGGPPLSFFFFGDHGRKTTDGPKELESKEPDSELGEHACTYRGNLWIRNWKFLKLQLRFCPDFSSVKNLRVTFTPIAAA